MATKTGAVVMVCALAVAVRADWVVMQNGDRYSGKVLSVTRSNLVLQSDVLGEVSLRRAHIASVTFGTNSAAPAPVATRPAATNTPADVSAALRQLAAHTNLIQKVQSQFLAVAGPEANERFSRMLDDLTSGKMTIADLRAQAEDAADQLRALQSDSGAEGSFTIGLYLSILDRFLKETAPSTGATSNAPANTQKP